uniref:Chaperone protein ClpB n=1 Tax=Candidatus Aschnera chinzeii TaxID=1485666 RepID=A0AAT9G594_9ENTR|nr:MAG: ATP-dependent chaperone ClpB [Candidatus Aschnera chinzeii]
MYMNNKMNVENEFQILHKYTVDLTKKAEDGNLDPVIGRDEEIRRTIQILQRRTKNNPVLIGDPGVGKTAIVEGLAQRIINSEIPDGLKNKRVLSLDFAAMLAGAKYRGEFEERLKTLLQCLTKIKNEKILFIDELHTIVGINKIEGAMDVSNILKPALARGELHCIGATTLSEYHQYIEKDAALERRFQKIYISEPTINDTIAILRGLKERYELHHHVQITDSAIIAATNLSNRYIHDRMLPDKAIDLIDEAGSSLRVQMDSKPESLDRLERIIIQLKLEQQVLKKEFDEMSNNRLKIITEELKTKERIFFDLTEKWKAEKRNITKIQSLKSTLENLRIHLEQVRRTGDLEKMSELQYGKIPALEKELKSIIKEKNKIDDLLHSKITDVEIATIVARWTGIPVTKMLKNECDKLLNMEKQLSKVIVGQNTAIHSISNAIRRSRSGISDPNKPIGSFLFLGPTGVGKTELCKALSLFLFDIDNSMIRLDMSEYMEKHSASKLIGAPPGYIGYEAGGYLTKLIKEKPYSVILFDEIEKAHPDVFNILLQVLDAGRLTDGHGKTVDFRNAVLIMTSNLASDLIYNNFMTSNMGYYELKNIVMNVVMNTFKPEFINRIDDVIVFHPLTKEHIESIAQMQISQLCKRIKNQGYNVSFTSSVIRKIINVGYNPVFGARPLKRAIQDEIENPLAKYFLSDKCVKNKEILIDIDNILNTIKIKQ